MSRRYTDHYDDPTWDPEDEAYGDYDEDGLSGFSVSSIYDTDDEEDDDD